MFLDTLQTKLLAVGPRRVCKCPKVYSQLLILVPLSSVHTGAPQKLIHMIELLIFENKLVENHLHNFYNDFSKHITW